MQLNALGAFAVHCFQILPAHFGAGDVGDTTTVECTLVKGMDNPGIAVKGAAASQGTQRGVQLQTADNAARVPRCTLGASDTFLHQRHIEAAFNQRRGDRSAHDAGSDHDHIK